MTAGLLTAGDPVSTVPPPTRPSGATRGPHQARSALRASAITLSLAWPMLSSAPCPSTSHLATLRRSAGSHPPIPALCHPGRHHLSIPLTWSFLDTGLRIHSPSSHSLQSLGQHVLSTALEQALLQVLQVWKQTRNLRPTAHRAREECKCAMCWAGK